MTTEEQAVKALLFTAPQFLGRVFRPDNSIATTRIGISCLEYFGVDAEPLSVGARIFNPKAVEIVQREGHMIAAEDPRAQEFVDEGYYVALIGKTGEKVQPGGWDGHLVIATENNLVDLILGNASSLEHDLDLTPSSFERPAGMGDMDHAGYELPNGIKLIYALFHDDTSYRTARDWNAKKFEDTTGIIIRMMRAWIEDGGKPERLLVSTLN